MSFEEGALLEPISVCLYGIESAGIKLADPVLICGAGPIGLVSAILARAAGAAPIAITDISQSRLDFAKKMVPGIRTILVERGVSAEDVARTAVKAMGVQPRVALECTGVESSLATAIYSVKFSGIVHAIGVGKDFQNIPFMHASVNDINIKFQYRYANTWPKGIRLINEGVINVKPLVTHRFSLEDAKKAFATTSDPTSGSVKVMIFDEL
jgi:L-iditol 2-dehydrogenase